jgi:hypothetical protein
MLLSFGMKRLMIEEQAVLVRLNQLRALSILGSHGVPYFTESDIIGYSMCKVVIN